MSYRAPLNEMKFVMRELAGLAQIQSLPGFEDATDDTVAAVLEENGKLMAEVVAPLNRVGDMAPSHWQDGRVVTTEGFKQAFRAYTQAGWQGLQHPTAYGGQGLPKLVATPCMEMLQSANLSFALCPLLTDGAIEALLTAGTDAQREGIIPRLIDGRWTGTMNLTEPQAGSDLAQVRSRAVPQADGSYRVFGQKIYITFGEHDLADNIMHLVLARTPDAPEGVKGISLFVVPKVLFDGPMAGRRNDVWCASIEHKLGIKASPTAVLIYGDAKGDKEVGAGAIGFRVGEENRGLEYMFIMMNAARFQVGMQGVAVSERAYQKAVSFARDRVQGRAIEGSAAAVPIIRHPDVRRMLMTMRAMTEAARAVAYVTAAWHDIAEHHADPVVGGQSRAAYEYMVPIVKGWSTELALEVTSLGVQVHGGMGFIEETGAAQHYRDARILPIYEGTTAIQANDLVGRKTARDGGTTAKQLIAQMRQTLKDLAAQGDDEIMRGLRIRLAAAVDDYAAVVDFVVASQRQDPRAVAAGAVPYLMLAGLVHGGWQLARSALVAREHLGASDPQRLFMQAKLATARFFADHLLSRVAGLRVVVMEGASGSLMMDEVSF